MNIFLTYDYELFFGEQTGSVEKCILEPTRELLAMSDRQNIPLIFFIDTGYLLKMRELKNRYPQVQKEYDLVTENIRLLVQKGHDCQLHIHPHWEDSTHNGKKWIMNTNRYKLVDFDEPEILDLVTRHRNVLQEITGKPVHAYRAGGWCLQPFDKIREAFLQNDIQLDSTVFPGGKFTLGNYYYDFTETPPHSTWRFSSDLCQNDPDGEFVEYPISSYRYSPLFFWKLFVLGRLNPKNHKPAGDGYPMPSPGMRKKMLSSGMLLSANSDGYFVTKLPAILKQNQKRNFNEMVVLGHPKACTTFALKKLEQFISSAKNNHRFMMFSQVIDRS